MTEHLPPPLSSFERSDVRARHVKARNLLLHKGQFRKAHTMFDQIAAIQGAYADLEFRTLYASSEVAMGEFASFDPKSALPSRKDRLYKSVTENADDLNGFVATLLETSLAISVNDTSLRRIKENREALSRIGSFLDALPEKLSAPKLESVRNSRISEVLQYGDYPPSELQKDLGALCQKTPPAPSLISYLYTTARNRLSI